MSGLYLECDFCGKSFSLEAGIADEGGTFCGTCYTAKRDNDAADIGIAVEDKITLDDHVV